MNIENAELNLEADKILYLARKAASAGKLSEDILARRTTHLKKLSSLLKDRGISAAFNARKGYLTECHLSWMN